MLATYVRLNVTVPKPQARLAHQHLEDVGVTSGYHIRIGVDWWLLKRVVSRILRGADQSERKTMKVHRVLRGSPSHSRDGHL